MVKAIVKPEDSEETNPQASGYTKQQFLGSEKYTDRKDVLNALLEEGKTYTTDEIDRLVDEFMKQEVK